MFKWKQYGLREGRNPGQAGMTCMMIVQYMAWKEKSECSEKQLDLLLPGVEWHFKVILANNLNYLPSILSSLLTLTYPLLIQ